MPNRTEQRVDYPEFSAHASKLILHELGTDDSWREDMRRVKCLVCILEKILAVSSHMADVSFRKLGRAMTKVQRSKYEMLCAPAQQIVAVWKAKVREVPRVAKSE